MPVRRRRLSLIPCSKVNQKTPIYYENDINPDGTQGRIHFEFIVYIFQFRRCCRLPRYPRVQETRRPPSHAIVVAFRIMPFSGSPEDSASRFRAQKSTDHLQKLLSRILEPGNGSTLGSAPRSGDAGQSCSPNGLPHVTFG